jgi:hypothetical protein
VNIVVCQHPRGGKVAFRTQLAHARRDGGDIFPARAGAQQLRRAGLGQDFTAQRHLLLAARQTCSRCSGAA